MKIILRTAPSVQILLRTARRCTSAWLRLVSVLVLFLGMACWSGSTVSAGWMPQPDLQETLPPRPTVPPPPAPPRVVNPSPTPIIATYTFTPTPTPRAPTATPYPPTLTPTSTATRTPVPTLNTTDEVVADLQTTPTPESLAGTTTGGPTTRQERFRVVALILGGIALLSLIWGAIQFAGVFSRDREENYHTVPPILSSRLYHEARYRYTDLNRPRVQTWLIVGAVAVGAVLFGSIWVANGQADPPLPTYG